MWKSNINIKQFVPVGSRITCNPPIMNTDEDWLVLVSDLIPFEIHLRNLGFELGGYDLDDNIFRSYTKNELNLIVTNNEEFYNKFILASKVATALNLMQKADRITLFQAILYGN